LIVLLFVNEKRGRIAAEQANLESA
jgi:hypothetical protein